MPDKIQVDVTDLDIGDAVHIGDLQVPNNVELLAEEGLTVITVVAPTVVKEEVPEEEELEEGLEETEAGAEEASEEASEQ
jgi:large subunit ribosomal protein L25